MNKDQIIEELKTVQDKKGKAITAQNYEMASRLRDRERELLIILEEIEHNEQKNGR
ncbi:MAG: UvrB/UvrC motif-containing protein [Bacteroidota bacterium]